MNNKERVHRRGTPVRNAPVLVERLELRGHALAPPLPFQRPRAFTEAFVGELDDGPVQVKQGDFGTRGWVEVNTVQTRAFGTERGFEPLIGRGCVRFREKRVNWRW